MDSHQTPSRRRAPRRLAALAATLATGATLLVAPGLASADAGTAPVAPAAASWSADPGVLAPVAIDPGVLGLGESTDAASWS